MKQFYLCIFTIIILLNLQNALAYQCPDLNCTEPIGGDICFLHPGDSPVSGTIRTFYCPSDQWCFLEHGSYAWVKASKQSISEYDTPSDSNVFQKYNKKQCEDLTTFQQALQNGRTCEVSAQCLSNNCGGDGRCVGKEEGKSCFMHSECDIGLGCNPDSNFPYITTCKKLSGNSSCVSSYECLINYICWPDTPAAAKNGSKSCIEIFSQPNNKIIGFINDTSKNALENSLNAGEYCKSGMAYIINSTAAMCVEIARVQTNLDNYKTAQASPFYCNLSLEYSSPAGCRYQFRYPNGTYSTIAEDYCECSLQKDLNDQNIGICSHPGQDQMYTYVNSLRFSMENSDCQTIDWQDMLAQKDCGIGSRSETYQNWTTLVEAYFNVTYWPYVQSSENRECLTGVMADSLTNLIKTLGLNAFGSLILGAVISLSLLAM